MVVDRHVRKDVPVLILSLFVKVRSINEEL